MRSSDSEPSLLAAIDMWLSDAPAIRSADTAPTSYRELRDRTLDVAGKLAGTSLVALRPGSSVDAIELVIAALRAHRPFMPLDPALPDALARDLVVRTGAASIPDGIGYAIATSGTTGRPKIALIGRPALDNYAVRIAAYYDLCPDDIVFQGAPFGFDVWLEEVLPTLASGASVLVTGHRLRLPYRDLAPLVARHGVTVLNLPAGFWAGWCAYLRQMNSSLPDCLRLVIVGSESVPAESARWWLDHYPRRPRLLAAYGMVEATVTSLVYDVTRCGVPPGEPTVPLGWPVAGTRMRLLPGRAGEIQLAGPGLFHGYLDDPTWRRLVTDHDGTRWLRTGDLGETGSDGVLRFRGRDDDQVKVSGFRVSLSDTADAIRALADVVDCIVVQPTAGGPLAAAIRTPDGAEIPEFGALLAAALPAHQVPTRLRFTGTMPKLPTGKVDMRAVRRWFSDAIRPRPEPGTDIGTIGAVLGAASTILRRRVGPTDNFFAMGGNSLLALRLIADLELDGLLLDVTDVFVSGTFDELANRARPTPARNVTIPRRARQDEPCPLTQQQLSVWYHSLAYPRSRSYNAQSRLDIQGSVSTDRLRQAIAELTDRHQALRTSFHESADGRPYQRVARNLPPSFTVLDATTTRLDPLTLERNLLGRHFDLANAPLARWTLVRFAEDHHALYLIEHHLVHDGVSFAILMQELRALMAGQTLPDDQRIDYPDYATWQAEQIAQGRFAEPAAHRAASLADIPPLASLAERAAAGPSDKIGGVHITYLSGSTAALARAAAGRLGTTLFVFLLTVFSQVLARHFRQDRFAIGVSVANRTLPELTRTVGMLVNTVAIPFDWTTSDFTETLRRAHTTAADAYAHQSVPFNLVVKALNPRRRPNSNPIYQVTFNFDDAPVPRMTLGSAVADIVELQSGDAKVDLSLVGVPQREQRRLQGEDSGREDIRLILQYRRATWQATEVARLAREFVATVGVLSESLAGAARP